MIDGIYTLFTRIPLFRDLNGVYAADPLWEWDLARHYDYISDLRICCPVKDVSEHAGDVTPVDGLSDRNVSRLNVDRGWASVFKNLVPTGIRIFRALSNTDIAHSQGAGWPFPESYYLLLFRPFLRFKWIIVVESSFYRIPRFGRASFRQLLSHHLNTFLVRSCARSANARIFTTKEYETLFLGHSNDSLVAPVVWAKEANIRPIADFEDAKPEKRRSARLIFPSRLVPDKGVQTVLDAIRILAEQQTKSGDRFLQVDIMGFGPLAEKCREFSQKHSNELVRFFDPLPYGPDFFSLLRTYDALIVASVQEGGQPRIIYDAFSQGLPCVASDTLANREAVKEGETGVLFKAGDANSLADRVIEFAHAPDRLHDMGRRALRKAATRTHEEMHRTREKFLIKTLKLSLDESYGKTTSSDDR